MENEYKIIIARNLRTGIARIKEMYMEQLRDNPLVEQWTYLSVKEHFDLDFHAHKKSVEDQFARNSKKLFSKVAMARQQMNVSRGGL